LAQTVVSFTVIEWKKKHRVIRKKLYSREASLVRRSSSADVIRRSSLLPAPGNAKKVYPAPPTVNAEQDSMDTNSAKISKGKKSRNDSVHMLNILVQSVQKNDASNEASMENIERNVDTNLDETSKRTNSRKRGGHGRKNSIRHARSKAKLHKNAATVTLMRVGPVRSSSNRSAVVQNEDHYAQSKLSNTEITDNEAISDSAAAPRDTASHEAGLKVVCIENEELSKELEPSLQNSAHSSATKSDNCDDVADPKPHSSVQKFARSPPEKPHDSNDGADSNAYSSLQKSARSSVAKSDGDDVADPNPHSSLQKSARSSAAKSDDGNDVVDPNTDLFLQKSARSSAAKSDDGNAVVDPNTDLFLQKFVRSSAAKPDDGNDVAGSNTDLFLQKSARSSAAKPDDGNDVVDPNTDLFLQKSACSSAAKPDGGNDVVDPNPVKSSNVKKMLARFAESSSKHKAAKEIIREAELRYFKEDMKGERIVLLTLCYAGVAFFTVFSIWINVLFGVKFDRNDQAAWIELTFITLALDLILISFLKVLFVWLVPQNLLGVMVLVVICTFVAFSATCGSMLATTGAERVCQFLTI